MKSLSQILSESYQQSIEIGDRIRTKRGGISGVVTKIENAVLHIESADGESSKKYIMHISNAIKDEYEVDIEDDVLSDAFDQKHIDMLRNAYKNLGKTTKLSTTAYNKVMTVLKKANTNDLQKIVKANITHLSSIASKLLKESDEYRTKTGAYKKTPKDSSSGLSKKYAANLSDEDEEKQKAEFEKRKEMRDDDPEAYELTKQDVEAKEKGVVKQSKHTKKYKELYGEELNEEIAGLRTKSDESGIAYSILKQVYDRGMAAWKTGHRPGTTPQQWAFARVNSFITGGKTRSTADKDLWDKVKKEETEIYEESEYQGKKVTLNKPFRTPDGPKKFAVYVRNDKGNVIKLGFGDPNMEIKRDDPERRSNYRARHNCSDPGPKWKANYWSCKFWSEKSVSDLLKEE